MLSYISTFINKIFINKAVDNFRYEEVLGTFSIGIPISKVEVTDKYRIITAHGIYNGHSVGFKLQMPLATESSDFRQRLKDVQGGDIDKQEKKFTTLYVVTPPKYSATFFSVGDETLNLFNTLGVGKFKKIKPAVEFIFANIAGDANQIDSRYESKEEKVCLNYSTSIFPHLVPKDGIRMKIATYYEDDPAHFSINGLEDGQELEFLIDVLPSEKMIYFMEKNTENRHNLRYTFADYNHQEVENILKSADQGAPQSQFLAGNIYESGTDKIKADIKKALFYWEKSAQSGNVTAQNRLADLYAVGKYIKKDFQKSHEWYSKAASKNNPHALYNLGVECEGGIGREVDLDKAISYYKRAAESGYVHAQVALADLYLKYKEDIQKACKMYKIVLKQADIYHDIARIYYLLGRSYCFFGSDKTGINKEEALAFLKKSFLLGIDESLFLYTSLGFNQGFGEDGHKWICDMNEKYPDNPYCAFAMGRLYQRGVLSQDYNKAFKYYKMAAESAISIPEAKHALALMYYNGQGTDPDQKAAFEWELKAAEELPEAQFNVGVSYFNGTGVEENVKKAAEWLQKAAGNGYAKAQKVLEQYFNK